MEPGNDRHRRRTESAAERGTSTHARRALWSRAWWLATTRKLLLGAAVLAFTLGAAIYVAYDARVPDIEPLLHGNPTNTSFMRWRSGNGSSGLLENPSDIEWMEIDSISPILVCSVLKAEDTTFFEHDGLIWAEMAKAAVRHLRGQFGGGSTISQQLAKNLFLSADVELGRKFREVFITMHLERTLSKKRILEIYLNVIEWGDGVWGIAAASRHYFDKSPAELNTFESVVLTSLIPAPLEPFTGWNLPRFRSSNLRVLDRIYYAGLISGREWREARARLKTVNQGVTDGRPLIDFLDVRLPVPEVPLAPIRYKREALPLSSALDEGCGRVRERAESNMRRRTRNLHTGPPDA